MQGLELAEACRLYAEEKKAEDVIILRLFLFGIQLSLIHI